MSRLLIGAALAALVSGCHYNEYVNKETGTRDTATEDIPTQRVTAPQGQDTTATNNAEKLPDSAGADKD